MGTRNFRALLQARWDQELYVCVGLDTNPTRIPESARLSNLEETIVGFNSRILEAVGDIVATVKPNSAFYEGVANTTRPEDFAAGFCALRRTFEKLQEKAPNVPGILDFKRGDIGASNNGYIGYASGMHADAVTVHPYLGEESLRPLLDIEGLGIFVLCRTSNPGGGEFQDRLVVPLPEDDLGDEPMPFYLYVAARVATWQTRAKASLGLVTGATYPDEIAQVRARIGYDMPLLIPGVGKQGGDLAAAVQAAGRNFVVNNSSGVTFASKGPDYAAAARAVVEKMNDDIAAALVA